MLPLNTIALVVYYTCENENFEKKKQYLSHTLYSRKAPRGISDIPPRRPYFIQITLL
jgi:hypothetical protein